MVSGISQENSYRGEEARWSAGLQTRVFSRWLGTALTTVEKMEIMMGMGQIDPHFRALVVAVPTLTRLLFLRVSSASVV